MKKLTIKAIILFAACITLFSACKKEKYFFDSGTEKATFNGSILTYLKSKPIYFDTLTKVIEIAGMNDVFDKQNITFFAPTSSAIYKSVKGLNIYLRQNGRDTVAKLEQIKPAAWKELLSQYIFKGTNRLKDYPQVDTLNMAAFPGQGYTAMSGRTMNIGVLFNDAVVLDENNVVKSRIRYAGYRQLYVSYIPNYADPKIGLINAPVASSDVAPTNGIVHVLAQEGFLVIPGSTPVWKSKHNFGFSTNLFINTVQSYGISPL